MIEAFCNAGEFLFNVLLFLIILRAYKKTKNIGYLLFIIPLFIFTYLITWPLKNHVYVLLNMERNSVNDVEYIEKLFFYGYSIKIVLLLQLCAYILSFYVLLKKSTSTKSSLCKSLETPGDVEQGK